MSNLKRSILFILLISIYGVKGQTIKQIGYYSVNGISALSAKPNYIVLGNGKMINVSNPSSPILTGSISVPGFSTSVLVDNNFVYLGTGMSVTLIIADISNPNFPLQVGRKDFPQLNGGIFGLSKKNNILYMAMGANGVYSVDVTNHANPVVLGSISIPGGQSRDIITKGNYAYVANGDGLKILDISNPSKLNLVTSTGSGYNAIDLANNFVFLGKDLGGIDVFDITNPISPVPAFQISNASGTAWDLKVKNNLIYLATDAGGLYIYKFNSSSALPMAHFDNKPNGQSFGVTLQDSLIFLSGLINGIAILKYDSLGVNTEVPGATRTEKINMFPNPAQNYIEFNQQDEAINLIEILNIYGQTVMEVNCDPFVNKIDISNLKSGNYIVCFKNQKYCWRRKLIKIE